MSHLQVQEVVEGSREHIFQFLVNLSHLPQYWDGPFDILSVKDPSQLERGAIFSFEMGWSGLSAGFEFELIEVNRPNLIVFKLRRGPIKSWRHRIQLVSHSESQTLVQDQIDYELGFGLLGLLADDLVVRAELSKILKKRLENMGQMLKTSKPQ